MILLKTLSFANFSSIVIIPCLIHKNHLILLCSTSFVSMIPIRYVIDLRVIASRSCTFYCLLQRNAYKININLYLFDVAVQIKKPEFVCSFGLVLLITITLVTGDYLILTVSPELMQYTLYNPFSRVFTCFN